jgi:hypothetical protein
MVPHWRCIRDDKDRIMVAICHNLGRRLGVVRRSKVPGEMSVAGLPDRNELFGL